MGVRYQATTEQVCARADLFRGSLIPSPPLRVVLSVLVGVLGDGRAGNVEIEIQIAKAGLQGHWPPTEWLFGAVIPDQQLTGALGEIVEAKLAFGIRLNKVRSLEDQNKGSHIGVHVAEQIDRAGTVEDMVGTFSAAVKPDIEPVPRTERKHIVLNGVEIRKANAGA